MSFSGMTGFFRAEGALEPWTWSVEARSVNGRNLEVRYRGPPGFDGLERAVREAAQARFRRGQVGVTIQARRSEAVGAGRVNLAVLERYLGACEPYVADGRAAPPAMDGLLALRGVIDQVEEGDEAAARAELEIAMAVTATEALNGLKLAREEEGGALHILLTGLLNDIGSLGDAALEEARAQPALIKEKFARRLADLIGEAASEDRIVQEAAAMAVRADVQEELDRLASHVTAGRALLAQDAAAGRRLDFLTQELMREANTLCAKSASAALTSVGLELKAAIDRFREQAQNVE